MKLNERSEIWGSRESDHKMAVFLELMSPNNLTNLKMKAAVSSEILYTCTSVHDIAYQETQFYVGMYQERISSKRLCIHWLILKFCKH